MTVVLEGGATPDPALVNLLHNGGETRRMFLVLHDGSAASSRYDVQVQVQVLHASFSGTATRSSGNRTLVLDLGHLITNGQTIYRNSTGALW